MYDILFEKKKEIIGKPATFFQLSEFSTIIKKSKENGKWTVVLPMKTLKEAVFTAKTTISLLTHSNIDYLLIIAENISEDIEEYNLLLKQHLNKNKEFVNYIINSSLDSSTDNIFQDSSNIFHHLPSIC